MNVKIDIHDNNKEVEKKLSSLDKWKVPNSVKVDVRKFIEKAEIGQVKNGMKLSARTISKYLTLLKHSLEILNKSTDKLTKRDIEKYDKELTSENLKSVADFRRNIKIFLNWKIGESKAREIAGWLDTRTKNKTPDYLSEQEVEKLYKNCKSDAERFLIAILFDSGARAEELLNVRFEDIQLPDKNENFVKLTLKEEYSKTKGRVISLYWKHSLEAAREFLKARQEEGIKSGEPVFNKRYDAMRMFLFRLGRKILKKDIYPHLFRHSSATYYAPKLNRQELCYRYGWAFSSDMPDVYISRAGMENKQLDEKFTQTELSELQAKFERQEQASKIMQETLEKRKKFDAILDKLIQNPKLMEVLKR